MTMCFNFLNLLDIILLYLFRGQYVRTWFLMTSNGKPHTVERMIHVTNDVTWPREVKKVTHIPLSLTVSKSFWYRVPFQWSTCRKSIFLCFIHFIFSHNWHVLCIYF